MMGAYDFYDKAREIAKKLDKTDFADSAIKILEAIGAGSTATEILMMLRWEFNQLMQNGIVLPDDVRKDIGEFIRRVDEVLC